MREINIHKGQIWNLPIVEFMISILFNNAISMLNLALKITNITLLLGILCFCLTLHTNNSISLSLLKSKSNRQSGRLIYFS